MKRGTQAAFKPRDIEFREESSARSIDVKPSRRVRFPQAVVTRDPYFSGRRRDHRVASSLLAEYKPTKVSYVISVQYTDEQIDVLEDAVVTSLLDWPDLKHYDTSELRPWRGVFSPPHKPKILFSELIEIEVTSLPRWKPQITIDRRTLDRADD
jgi:hypothetical protein